MRKLFLTQFNQVSTSQPKPTFGQKRAEQLTQRLDKAISDRRKLARAEAASADPLKSTYMQKANLVEKKIDRLTAEISDAKK